VSVTTDQAPVRNAATKRRQKPASAWRGRAGRGDPRPGGGNGMIYGYTNYGLLARPGALPAADYLAAVSNGSVLPLAACLGFILLLTPTGSLPSPRWRWWARLSTAASVLGVLSWALVPFEGPFQSVTNPLAMATLGVAGIETPLGWLSAGCVALLPLAIGAAILRYRLYDLDRIISRTLAWGCSRCCLVAATPWWSWGWARSWAGTPASRWPPPPWVLRPVVPTAPIVRTTLRGDQGRLDCRRRRRGRSTPPRAYALRGIGTGIKAWSIGTVGAEGLPQSKHGQRLKALACGAPRGSAHRWAARRPSARQTGRRPLRWQYRSPPPPDRSALPDPPTQGLHQAAANW
jgi:hypothetical protein